MNHHQPDLDSYLVTLYNEIDSLTASEMRDVVLQFALGHRADYEAAVKITHILKQAAASRGNPYASSVEAKHGLYSAPSAAAVALDLEPEAAARCPECARDIATEHHQIGCPMDAIPPAPTGHLPQHTHGQPGCTYPGCHDHPLPALTAVADAGRLAGHMPEGAL